MVFVKIAKCFCRTAIFCPNCKMYCRKLQVVFVRIFEYICQKARLTTTPPCHFLTITALHCTISYYYIAHRSKALQCSVYHSYTFDCCKPLYYCESLHCTVHCLSWMCCVVFHWPSHIDVLYGIAVVTKSINSYSRRPCQPLPPLVTQQTTLPSK